MTKPQLDLQVCGCNYKTPIEPISRKAVRVSTSPVPHLRFRYKCHAPAGHDTYIGISLDKFIITYIQWRLASLFVLSCLFVMTAFLTLSSRDTGMEEHADEERQSPLPLTAYLANEPHRTILFPDKTTTPNPHLALPIGETSPDSHLFFVIW
jgi:hypothetical protein